MRATLPGYVTIAEEFSYGHQGVDAVLDTLSWTGTTGQPATVYYDYKTAGLLETESIFTEQQIMAAEQVMDLWENVANVTFVRDATSAFAQGILFSKDVLGEGTAGITYTTYMEGSPNILYADVNIDPSIDGYEPGQFGWLVMIHEIGHALGLKHPGNYGSGDHAPFAIPRLDTMDYTVMSYNDGFHGTNASAPRTPMLYDIAAMQLLYGANRNYNAGNTTYEFNGDPHIDTIWDGGGIDTISTVNAVNALGVIDSVVDLREGEYTYSAIGDSFIWNAFGANIENAVTGPGSDTVYGNTLANYIFTGAGNDAVDAAAGNDSLYGGAGHDTLSGREGNDIIRGGRDNDNVNGNQGNDQVYGDIGDDRVQGGRDNDFVQGNAGNDYVNGNIGNDTILGGQDNDTLMGGQDNDLIYGNMGADWLSGDRGNDTLDGGDFADTYYFSHGSGTDTILRFDLPGAGLGDILHLQMNINGSGIASAADALARVSYSGGNAVLDLGGGNSVTLMDVAAGSLTADDFLLS